MAASKLGGDVWVLLAGGDRRVIRMIPPDSLDTYVYRAIYRVVNAKQ